MNRRDFLKSTAGAAFGAAAVLGLVQNQSCSQERHLNTLGVQIYTMGSMLRDDPEGTLRAVKNAGYDQVEFAGYGGMDVNELRNMIDDIGLTSPANHFRNLATPEGVQQAIDDAKVMGNEYVIMPSVPREWRPQVEESETAQEEGERPPEPVYTAADVRNLGARMNDIATTCQEAGLQFAYHNHYSEFENVSDGGVWYDILLDSTDPDLVYLEMDLGWTTRGGADPVEYFKRYPGRFRAFHVKDITADEQRPCIVGEGIVDFQRIFAQSRLAGVEYYFVEQDGAPEPVEDITESAEYLKNLTF